jgi:hypothetical protein
VTATVQGTTITTTREIAIVDAPDAGRSDGG